MPESHDQVTETQLQAELKQRLESSACLAAKQGTVDPMDISESSDPILDRCRRDLLAMEQATPLDAVRESWNSESWQNTTQRASTIADLKSCLATFEAALHQGWLSPQYLVDRPLVKTAWVHTGECSK